MTSTAPRSRRRSLIRAGVVVAACLALGAVVNFGVAWWCVRGFEAEYGGGWITWSVLPGPSAIATVKAPKTVEELPPGWSVAVPPEWPAPGARFSGEFGWLSMTAESGSTSPGDEYIAAFVHRTDVGWPLRCWWGARRTATRTTGREYVGPGPLRQIEFSRAGKPFLGVRFMPYGIHPLAFIVNTLVYAALPLAVWCAAGPWRRWLRRRAGRCEACGYDRAGLAEAADCPECGAPAHVAP